MRFDVPEHVAAARHLPTRLRGAKSSAPATAAPRSSIAIAARLLHDQHIGALVASEDGATIPGIITERDISSRPQWQMPKAGSRLHGASTAAMETRTSGPPSRRAPTSSCLPPNAPADPLGSWRCGEPLVVRAALVGFGVGEALRAR